MTVYNKVSIMNKPCSLLKLKLEFKSIYENISFKTILFTEVSFILLAGEMRQNETLQLIHIS